MKFALILSGCGVYDGAEIHESVLSMYALSKRGIAFDVFAPDIKQHHVVNHLTGNETAETRNVLAESARIARGKISPLSQLKVNDYDSLLLPGGFGVAKNLCDFAFSGENMTVIPELEKVLTDFHTQGKPIGALCISPVIFARMFKNSRLTIGNEIQTAQMIVKMGAVHIEATHGEVVIDNEHRIVTTPCYMLDASIAQIAEGTENIVDAMEKMIKK